MVLALLLSALLWQRPLAESPAMLPPAGPELTVYVFTTTDCPISNRYAPEVKRLAERFTSKASFILVYPVRTDTPAMIREHLKTYDYQLHSVRDLELRLVKQTGVTMTPEVAVMKGGQLMYRGRIDDRYVELGRERPAPTSRDLENALEAILAGKAPAVRETQAVGCILSDLVK